MILSERLLITRIITSVALALLLIVGAWMATHTEPEAAAPTASSVTEHVDAHIAPIAAGAPVIDQGTTSPTLLGVAACVCLGCCAGCCWSWRPGGCIAPGGHSLNEDSCRC